MSTPPPRMELGGSKDWWVWNIIMYKNGKVDSLEGSALPKVRIISKNGSNKSGWATNSAQKKSMGAHVYLPPEWR